MQSQRNSFTKGDLCALLKALAGEIKAKGQRVDLYLYGGSALVLRDETLRETTGDVDAYSPQRDLGMFFRETRKTVSETLKLKGGEPIKRGWLEVGNVDLSAMTAPDVAHEYFDSLDAYAPELAKSLEDTGLNVFIMKEEPQLAMKLARNTPDGPSEKDRADVRVLAQRAGIKDEDGLIAVWKKHAAAMKETAKTPTVIRNLRNKGYWQFGKAQPKN